MSKIKFAIVGIGHIGKRHIAMIERNPDCELAAICDLIPKEELGLENLSVPYFNNIQDLIESDLDFEVLNICTPNGLHAEQAILGLKAKKHVVIEKPMALKKVDAERIIFESLKVSKQVFVVMQNRYSPPSQWIREVMDQNLLGDIYSVQLNCYWNRDDRYYFKDGKKHSWHGTKKLDGGTLFTQFSHFIDLLYWLFGDIKNIKTIFNNFAHQHSVEFEDTGNVIFEFVNGGQGSINYSTAVWSENLESSMTIIAENGSVKIGGQYMDKVEYCNIKGYEMPELKASNSANDYGGYKGSANNHGYVFENVVGVLRNGGVVKTNALEGMKVVEVLEGVMDGYTND